jgi:hypothetical protein
MADTPSPLVPPVQPSGSVPPNPPQTEPDFQEDESLAAASALSPAALLGKRGTPAAPPGSSAAANATPMPAPVSQPQVPQLTVPQAAMPATPNKGVGPLGDEPTDDELIRTAASTPAPPLILPNRKAASGEVPISRPESAAVVRQSFTAEQGPQKQQSLSGTPVQSRAALEKLPEPPRPLPTAPELPNTPPAPPVPPAKAGAVLAPPPFPSQIKPPTPPAPPAGIRQAPPAPMPMGSGKSPLIPALLAGVLAIVLLGGGATVLAYTGARIPFIGPVISGVENRLEQVSARASSFVQTQEVYRLEGTLDMVEIDQKNATMPDGTPVLYKVKVETKEGKISDRGDRFMAYHEVTADDRVPVPVALRSTGTGGSWLTSFPANTSTDPAVIPASLIPDTLLGPALRPVPLESILKSLQTEQSYQKTSYTPSSGNPLPAAAYVAGARVEDLQAYFPAGSTLEAPAAYVAFAWKGDSVVAGQPLEAQLKGNFSYKDRKYSYVFRWKYSGWGEQAPAHESLKALVAADPSGAATLLTADAFVSRLGINSKSLPRGTAAAPDVNDGGSTFTPIVPSGEVVTSVQLPRLTPPKPIQPATVAAKARDTQRKKDLADIQKAIEEYKKDNGSYPEVAGEVQLASSENVFNALVQTYLTKMPVDPLNSVYFYAYNMVTDSAGVQTGYYLRSVMEDETDPSALIGEMYHFYQLTNE